MLDVEAFPIGVLKGQNLIYFINDNMGNMKIGKTNDISRRIRDLQTGNVNRLTVCSVIPGTRIEVEKLEKQLHLYFATYRKIGEWFEYTPVNEWLIENDLRFSANKLEKILKGERK